MKWVTIGVGVLLVAWSFRAMRRWHLERRLDLDA
jgi:hypothetical protein